MDSGGQALSFSIKRKNSVRRTDMQDAFSRMELLVGNTGVKKLSRAKIAVFGLGGAGSTFAGERGGCVQAVEQGVLYPFGTFRGRQSAE